MSRIGYNLGTLLSMKDVLSFSRLADGTENVHSIWVPESWGREALSSLGAISQVTKRVKLGTSVISIYSRTPATIAMATVTLDMLSCNRTILGLGVSTPEIVERWHGVKFESPIVRMREYIDCIRLILSGRRVEYCGTCVKIKSFKILHDPARNVVPIFVAAVNIRMIELATSRGNGILLYLKPLKELKKTVRKIRYALKKTHSRKDFEIASVFIAAISGNDPEKARTRASKTLAFYIATGNYYRKFLHVSGFHREVDAVADVYREEGLESASKMIPESMLDSLTISGSPEQCVKSLERFMSTGITLPIIQVNPVEDALHSFKEMLSTFKCVK
jgi:5,10-methylenetetrahydromethanopterin reductase